MSFLKFPRLTRNRLSALGSLLSIFIATAIILMMISGLIRGEENPYFGIFLYAILPICLIGSLTLIPIGMIIEWKRWKKSDRPVQVDWPIVNLNKAGHRNATVVFLAGTVALVLIGSLITYEAYHYSESVSFCGETCHAVMKPQYTAYQSSPHARVSCAECHVGYGAGWYAKSKLSGAYQVYAVLADKYPRPIPTPIENLRPAQETCETCHWPEKTYGAQQRQFNHFMYDDSNTAWLCNMLVKTGGGDPMTDMTSGIHWHMNIGVKIDYISRDEKRQDIPWVRVKDLRTGRVTLYENEDDPLSQEEIDTLETRRMDCLDCHNRPSHIFYSPDYLVDKGISGGFISADLPGIKRRAVEAMTAGYESDEVALRGIANFITNEYKAGHPDFYNQNRSKIDKAILAIQQAYSQNIFPYMNVDWSKYPNNIGHFTYPGCMRCHEGLHKSEEGLVISHDCNACHSILSQGFAGEVVHAETQEGLEFKHPEDIFEAWKEMGCYECHTGVQP
jgi:hypothetical protein